MKVIDGGDDDDDDEAVLKDVDEDDGGGPTPSTWTLNAATQRKGLILSTTATATTIMAMPKDARWNIPSMFGLEYSE